MLEYAGAALIALLFAKTTPRLPHFGPSPQLGQQAYLKFSP